LKTWRRGELIAIPAIPEIEAETVSRACIRWCWQVDGKVFYLILVDRSRKAGGSKSEAKRAPLHGYPKELCRNGRCRIVCAITHESQSCIVRSTRVSKLLMRHG